MIAFAVLTFLLHIGGIEKNPGPRKFSMEKEIRQMKNDILDELRKIHDDLGTVKEKCNNLEKTCGILEQRQCEMAMFMKNTETNLLRMEKNIDTQRKDSEMVSRQLDSVQDRIKRQERYLEKINSQTRRGNLRFFGIAEERNGAYEDCEKVMMDFLNKHYNDAEWSLGDITMAHRIGKRNEREPRLMMVKFARVSDASRILRNRSVRDIWRKQNVRVAADYTPRQNEELRTLRQQGKVGVVRDGRVIEAGGSGVGEAMSSFRARGNRVYRGAANQHSANSDHAVTQSDLQQGDMRSSSDAFFAPSRPFTRSQNEHSAGLRQDTGVELSVEGSVAQD